MANFENVNKIDVITPKHSYQDLSHTMKFSCDFGQLIPTSCFILAPNEKIQMKSDFFARMAPMYSPVMDGIDIYNWVFAVPLRLMYADFNDFLIGGADGTLSSSYEFPTCNINLASGTYTNRAGETSSFDYRDVFGAGSLADYLGLPTPITTADWSNIKDLTMPVLPFRCYHKIWNDYFRNQNLEPEEFEYKDGGNHDLAPQYAVLRYKNFNKDYFTSALTNTQLGSAVEIPFEASVSYNTDNFHPSKIRWKSDTHWSDPDDVEQEPYQIPIGASVVGEDNISKFTNIGMNTATKGASVIGAEGSVDNSASLKVGNMTATIQNLRYAIALQQFQELNLRAGHRYVEFVMAHYGSSPADARLQRAEYLGGSRTPIQISAVVQQSATTTKEVSGQRVTDSALGELAGYGVSAGGYDGLEFYTSEEFTMIMSIACVVPHNSYMQGMPKHLDIRNRFDLPIPMFAGLGDQPIEKGEVYFNMWDNDRVGKNQSTFGYTARYNQYRFLPDRIAGDFRTSLNSWHLARIWSYLNQPALNADFIKIDPEDYNRIFNVTSNDVNHFWIEVYHNIDAWRVIPRLGIPVMHINPTNDVNI